MLNQCPSLLSPLQEADNALISCTELAGVGGTHVLLLKRLDGLKGAFVDVTWALFYLGSRIMIQCR